MGWQENSEQPKWVMDILLFREMSAQDSLAFAKRQNWKFHQTLVQYLASFASDPTAAYSVLVKGFEKNEAAFQTGGTVGLTPA